MGIKIWLAATLLLFAACSSRTAAEQARAMAGDYADLTQRYDLLYDPLYETMRLSDGSDSERERLQAEKQRELNQLLVKYRNAPGSAALDLVRSKVMIEAGRYAEAEKIVARLSAGHAATASEAKQQRAVLHLVQHRPAEAANALAEIGPLIAPDAQYYNLCLALAFSHPDPVAREGFSRRLISASHLPARIMPLLPGLHANLAMLAKERRQVNEAMAHWDKALALENDPTRKSAWETERRQLALLDQPAPPFAADYWLVEPLPVLAQLKGKVVAIHFWAPWCSPCRQAIPFMQELHRRYRGQGLQVIGYTRLYGRYSDGSEEKLRVTATEEVSLIRKFVDRSRITYPVAVATEGEAFDAFAVWAVPTLLLIDRKGNIGFCRTGAGSPVEIEEKIAALLAEK